MGAEQSAPSAPEPVEEEEEGFSIMQTTDHPLAQEIPEVPPSPPASTPRVRTPEKKIVPVLEVTVYKAFAATPIGLTLEGSSGPPRVQFVAEDSLVQLTRRIRPNQQLLSINDIPVDGHQHASDLIRESEGSVVLKLMEDIRQEL